MSQTPKSAFELAMERLKAADQADGIVETPLNDAQKAAIADLRKLHASRIAEREILHRDALRRVGDPQAREKLEEEYRIDRQRIDSDRDRAIDKVRRGG